MLVLAGTLLVLAAGAAALWRGCHEESFVGERVKQLDSYTLKFQQMSGKESHCLVLTAGALLQVDFATEAGRLRLKLTAPDGTLLYAGNGEEPRSFALRIPQTGVYAVTVEARNARGSICIRPSEPAKEDWKGARQPPCDFELYRLPPDRWYG